VLQQRLDLFLVGRNKRSEVPAMRTGRTGIDVFADGGTARMAELPECRNCAELVPAYEVSAAARVYEPGVLLPEDDEAGVKLNPDGGPISLNS